METKHECSVEKHNAIHSLSLWIAKALLSRCGFVVDCNRVMIRKTNPPNGTLNAQQLLCLVAIRRFLPKTTWSCLFGSSRRRIHHLGPDRGFPGRLPDTTRFQDQYKIESLDRLQAENTDLVPEHEELPLLNQAKIESLIA